MIKEKSKVFLEQKPIHYFESAEEVWFWFCLCESTPRGRTPNYSGTMRPCETSDVAIIVKRLLLNKKLSQSHLKILSLYGLKQISPSEKYGDPVKHCFLWKQALEHLSDVFNSKGLIRKMSSVIGI